MMVSAGWLAPCFTFQLQGTLGRGFLIIPDTDVLALLLTGS